MKNSLKNLSIYSILEIFSFIELSFNYGNLCLLYYNKKPRDIRYFVEIPNNVPLKDIFDLYVKFGYNFKKVFFAWKTCTFKISRKFKKGTVTKATYKVYSDRKIFSSFENNVYNLDCFICYRIKDSEESKTMKDLLTKIYPKFKFAEKHNDGFVFSYVNRYNPKGYF